MPQGLAGAAGSKVAPVIEVVLYTSAFVTIGEQVDSAYMNKKILDPRRSCYLLADHSGWI